MPAVLLLDQDTGEDGRPHLHAVGDREPRQGRGPVDSTDGHGVVLVADDDDALRETVTEILSLEGYDVLQADDGEKALQVLGANEVDVLVLDLAMPRLDGLSVLTRLGSHAPKVILYSAFEYFSVDQLEQMGVRQNVFRLLRKPVPPPQLLSAVAEALAE